MMHEDKRKELERLLALVDLRISQLPVSSYEQRHERNKAVQELQHDLEQEGARFGDVSGNYTVSLAGVRAGSTMSVDSALQNWCVSVRKRIGGGS